MEDLDIVPVGSIYDIGGKSGDSKTTVAHEIAHQWFYGTANGIGIKSFQKIIFRKRWNRLWKLFEDRREIKKAEDF
ncbi:hypothetical protein [Oceanobacillus sp. J11TS1]|uniref:hypothetical protein n=1 Tax=Oceanobacillus sp. J11TS1 TaxID=2807191 RepID=UPI001B002101|nr:hypothetical protein [Oceanobacillus sp. J11TS1]GIO23847.1 hypothetical protein J11TS1_24280 [Oceanobacillus sp. J11TS1]